MCSSQRKEATMPRLDYEDILRIYKLISMDYTAYNIANIMKISPSTLYRMIKCNIETKKLNIVHNKNFRDCIHLPECRKKVYRCPKDCDRYEKYLCEKLKKFPFICDFCAAKTYCKKEHHYWNPDEVYLKRLNRLHDSRSHISLSKKQLSAFDEWISPHIKQKKSIEVLYSTYPEMFPISSSTVRRWINQSRLSVRRIDLVRAVSFKVKKEYNYKRSKNYNPLAKFGHTYSYFLEYDLNLLPDQKTGRNF